MFHHEDRCTCLSLHLVMGLPYFHYAYFKMFQDELANPGGVSNMCYGWLQKLWIGKVLC